MKPLETDLAEWLKKLPPAAVLAIALTFFAGMAVADFNTPIGLSFTAFYMIGVVFVGWCAGWWPATAASAVASGLIMAVEFVVIRPKLPGWVPLANTATRFVIFTIVGWLAAEAARLALDLRRIVAERTAQLDAEMQEHKATAARLAETVERFEQVVNNITEVFWLSDVAQTQMFYVSPGYERIWGRKREEVYRDPRAWLTALHPEDRDAIAQRSLTEQAGGGYDAQYRIVRPDGAVRWIRDRAFPVCNQQGEVYRIAGIAEDITERKRAELAKEAFLALGTKLSAARTPVEAARAIYASADQLWKWDSATLDLYSPETDQMQPLLYYDVMAGQRREAPPARPAGTPSARMGRIMRKGPELILRKPADMQTTDSVRFGDTSRLSASILCVPLRREGQPVGVMSIQSYTANAYTEEDLRTLQALADHCGGALERIRAETALREAHDLLELRVRERTAELQAANAALKASEGRLRLALDASGAQLAQIEAIYQSAPVGLCVLDTDFRYLRINERLAEMNGVPVQDHLGRAVREVVPQLAEGTETICRRAITTGQPVLNLELQGTTAAQPGGARSWVTHWTPLKQADGRVTGVSVVVDEVTERKRMEQALREARDLLETRVRERTAEWEAANAALRGSEERYRTLAESSPDAIFIIDRDLVVQYVNTEAAALWRRKPVEIIGRRQTELFPPESARHHMEVLQHVLETGESVRRDELISYPTGARWHEVRLVPLRDQHDHIRAVMGAVRDVTERRESELLLRAQRDLAIKLGITGDLKAAVNQLLQSAMQMGGVDSGAVYLLDASSGGMDLVVQHGGSPAFVEAISHWASDSPQMGLVRLGKPIFTLYLDLPISHDGPRLREGLRATALVPLCHEGIPIGALALFSRVLDEIPPHTRVVIEAIAAQAAGAIARIRAEAAWRQSEARLRATITGAPLILFAGDQHGVITFHEGHGLKALGLKPGQCVGQPVAKVFQDVPAIQENVRRALNGEEFSSVLDVGPVSLMSRYSPTKDNQGNVTGYIGVATDITERLRLERQILEISDREQARLGQDLHDGLCQQLVSLAFDANSLVRDLSAHARPEAARAGRLAEDLDEAITAARQLSRGRFPVRLISEGLPAALEELAHATQERLGIPCQFEREGRVSVPNQAVAIHLYRIAQEAVNNAAKHARPTRISIHLHARPGLLELGVEDDGIGVAPRLASKATGMGLHIMDYRARAIGGTLRVGPGTGRGTTVSCCLPQGQR